MKNHELIAIVDGRKRRAGDSLTAFYHDFQKDASHATFAGIARTYRPLDDASTEKFPDERKNVQKSVRDTLQPVLDAMSDAIDTVAGQDAANCIAKADVVVDGVSLLMDVPVTSLLYLDKRMVDIRTVIEKLPVLDPVELWEWDSNAHAYRSKPSETFKTKKVLRNHVKAEATDKHPAQVETYSEDIPIGVWTTVKFSGAIPLDVKQKLLANVNKVIDAVKVAREVANQVEAKITTGIGKSLLDFVFNPIN